MLELHHGEPNTFALKILIVLHEKGLDYASRYYDPLTGEGEGPPPGPEADFGLDVEGPVLVHDGRAVSEAFFAGLYLDEAFPERALRPSDASGRWAVLNWARLFGEVLAPSVCSLGAARHLVGALSGADREGARARASALRFEDRRKAWDKSLTRGFAAEEVEDSRRKAGLVIDRLEGALAADGWLVGGAFSLADIDAFALLHPLQALEPALFEGSAQVGAWLGRIRARPAVQAALAAGRTDHPEQWFRPGPEHSRWG